MTADNYGRTLLHPTPPVEAIRSNMSGIVMKSRSKLFLRGLGAWRGNQSSHLQKWNGKSSERATKQLHPGAAVPGAMSWPQDPEQHLVPVLCPQAGPRWGHPSRGALCITFSLVSWLPSLWAGERTWEQMAACGTTSWKYISQLTRSLAMWENVHQSHKWVKWDGPTARAKKPLCQLPRQ